MMEGNSLAAHIDNANNKEAHICNFSADSRHSDSLDFELQTRKTDTPRRSAFSSSSSSDHIYNTQEGPSSTIATHANQLITRYQILLPKALDNDRSMASVYEDLIPPVAISPATTSSRKSRDTPPRMRLDPSATPLPSPPTLRVQDLSKMGT